MKLTPKERLNVIRELRRRGGISDIRSDKYDRIVAQLQSEQIRPKVISSRTVKLRRILNIINELISYAVIFFVLWYLPVKCVTSIWHFIRRRIHHG